MIENKRIVNMNLIDKKILEDGCLKIIDELKEYSIEMKIAILHELIKNIPVEYVIIEKRVGVKK